MLNLQQFVGSLLDDAEIKDDVVVRDAGGAAEQLLDLRLAAADLAEHLLDARLQIRQDHRRIVELGRRRVGLLLGRLYLVLLKGGVGRGGGGGGGGRGGGRSCDVT